MNADSGRPLYTFAWVNDGSGTVYEWNGSAWSTTFSCPSCSNGYYLSKAVPMSLVARITAISTDGKTLTLDTAAAANATNANVYLDNELIVNDLTQPPRQERYAAITPSNLRLTFPSGSFAFAGYINAPSHTGWTIEGQGASSTTLYSAKGTFGAGIVAQESTGMTVQNFTLTGNLGLDQYGLNWPTTLSPIPASKAVTQYDATGKILLQQLAALLRKPRSRPIIKRAASHSSLEAIK